MSTTATIPGHEPRATARRTPLPGLVAALFLVVAPASADLVVFTHGDVLKVDRAVSSGDTVLLELPDGGSLEVPLLSVERVVDDEVAPPGGEVDAELPGGFDPFSWRGASLDAATPYAELLEAAARRHGLDARLLSAMTVAESSNDPTAVSVKGARGLMQLMPATARRFGVEPEALFDPASNIEAGARYVRWLAERFDGDLERVLAAYNAGEGVVDRYGGVPPFRETIGYVERVVGSVRAAGS